MCFPQSQTQREIRKCNVTDVLENTNPKIERGKLHSPKLYRNYIPPPILSEEHVYPEKPSSRRRARKQLLSVMNVWNKRRRSQRSQRSQRNQRSQRSQTLAESKKNRLQLSMKYGELSDNFYSYCRRWKKQTNFLARRDPPSPPVVSSQRPPLRLHFNFRFFTRLMLETCKSRLVRVISFLCATNNLS